MISKKVQFWKVIGAGTIDAVVSCLENLVCDFMQLKSANDLNKILHILKFGYADEKGFVCQQCGLIRNKEEIRKIARDIKTLLDKAVKSTSSGSILLYFSLSRN